MGIMLTTSLYLVVVVIWIASFVYRSALKKVRRASFLMGALLLGWAVMHLLKNQTESYPVLSRYIWYSYAFFELALPLVLLWLACGFDRPDGETGVPKWMRVLFAVNGAIAALCLTNDFHFFVHTIDIDSPFWMLDYSYNAGFYIWMAGWLLPLIASIFIMLIKIGVYVRKRMLLFMIFFFALLLVYQHGYVNRIPIIWESDRIIVNGILALLLVESIMRSGLIPVNTKYRKLFTHSPINMRIIDKSKQTALSSASSVWYDYDTFADALDLYPEPARQNEDTLLFAAPIIGGYALWQEDISILNRLHKETENSISKLNTANDMLAKLNKAKLTSKAEAEKTRVMEKFEAETVGSAIRLSTMFEQLESCMDKDRAVEQIVLLLRDIKRQCGLFSYENERDTASPDEPVGICPSFTEERGDGTG